MASYVLLGRCGHQSHSFKLAPLIQVKLVLTNASDSRVLTRRGTTRSDIVIRFSPFSADVRLADGGGRGVARAGIVLEDEYVANVVHILNDLGSGLSIFHPKGHHRITSSWISRQTGKLFLLGLIY